MCERLDAARVKRTRATRKAGIRRAREQNGAPQQLHRVCKVYKTSMAGGGGGQAGSDMLRQWPFGQYINIYSLDIGLQRWTQTTR